MKKGRIQTGGSKAQVVLLSRPCPETSLARCLPMLPVIRSTYLAGLRSKKRNRLAVTGAARRAPHPSIQSSLDEIMGRNVAIVGVDSAGPVPACFVPAPPPAASTAGEVALTDHPGCGPVQSSRRARTP
jgi:hypothetical protein